MDARMDDRGQCFGTGMPGVDIVDFGAGLRSGMCPECGRRVGLVRASCNRVTHHRPEVDERKRQNATVVALTVRLQSFEEQVEQALRQLELDPGAAQVANRVLVGILTGAD